MPKFFIDRFVEQKSSWISKRITELKRIYPPKHEYFIEDDLKEFIKLELEKYASVMNLHPSGLRFTQVGSYWGTCAPSGVLSFNLSLRYTPNEAVSYVVVHELAHLRWKGHGARFWAMVEKYYPRTKEMRKLLRQIPRSL